MVNKRCSFESGKSPPTNRHTHRQTSAFY